MSHVSDTSVSATILAAPTPGELGQAEDYAAPISDILRMAAIRAPGDTALLWTKGEATFKELEAAVSARMTQIVQWFEGRFGKSIVGERIGVFGKKDPGAILLLFAALRAGAIVVPLNPALKADQLMHIAANCDMITAFVPKRLADSLNALTTQTHWADQNQSTDASPNFNDIGGWAKGGASMTAPAIDPGSTGLLFYTSGSTGQPKGVMISHQANVLGAASVSQYVSLNQADRVLALLPISFDYGFNQIVSTWFAGGAVVLHDFFLPGDVIKAVERHGVTGIAAVPPLWHLLADLTWPDAASRTVRYITNSGGALTESLQHRLRCTFPAADVFAMYGLTEAFRSTFMEPGGLADKPTSIGKAIPFADVFAVTADGERAAVGDAGELMHAGPLVAQGYWNDPVKTAKRFRPVPDALKAQVDPKYHARCVFSGDKVYMDGDGDLHFVGRDDEMIKVLGNRLSPQEVEECACFHEGVTHALAFGIADDRMGAKICLVVEMPDKGASANDAVLQILRAQLPSYAVPSYIYDQAAFSRTPNGKIDRPAIKAWALKQIAEDDDAR